MLISEERGKEEGGEEGQEEGGEGEGCTRRGGGAGGARGGRRLHHGRLLFWNWLVIDSYNVAGHDPRVEIFEQAVVDRDPPLLDHVLTSASFPRCGKVFLAGPASNTRTIISREEFAERDCRFTDGMCHLLHHLRCLAPAAKPRAGKYLPNRETIKALSSSGYGTGNKKQKDVGKVTSQGHHRYI